MASIWIRIIFFLVISPITTNDRENQAASSQPMCLPFKALFLWHTSSGYDHSFVQQTRLMIKLIHDFPEGTDISVVTVGANMNAKLHFKKKVTNRSWINELMQYEPGNSTKHVIPYLELSAAVYSYFDKNENPKMAEEIFLVVNNKSIIDDKQKGVEVLEKKKTFIILFGKQSSRDVFTNLATDNRHIIGLDGSDDSINGATKSILNLSCQDSRLLCDTDKHWTGERCYRCTYVCSPDAWKPSEYCLSVCPYFKHSPPDKDPEVDHSADDPSGYQTAARHSVVNTFLLSVIIFVLVIIFCWKCKPLKAKILKVCRKRNFKKLKVCRNRDTTETKSSSSNEYSVKNDVQDKNAHVDAGNARVDDRVVADGDEHEPKTQIKDDNLPDTERVKQDVKYTPAKRESIYSDYDEEVTIELLPKQEDNWPEDKP
ncbi:uncharacterized protein LOC123558743 [Mercenaria mercenaria]|uniref:uncharacterized protein LOC123558743 n=1 Tax=Mercenaria mercenaria TaxID=6596 RepID=UPI00234F113F|nr:uncharacterized protein LOC123558743 [Mercenaria mercenaria]